MVFIQIVSTAQGRDCHYFKRESAVHLTQPYLAMPPGLTFAAKASPSATLSARLAGQKRKKTLFDDPDSDDEDAAPSTSSISTLSGLSQPKPKPSSRTSPPPKKSPKLAPRAFTAAPNLSSLHSSRKHATESAALDPTIYDYDTFYETSKSSSLSSSKKDEETKRSSRYFGDLIESKRIRERDALRAEEKKLAREREAEGDAFKDKDNEKFVTGAYRAQQEERRRAEAAEEEKERREEEERRRTGGGMTGLYAGVLRKEEARRKEIEEKERQIKEKIQKGEPAPEEATAAEINEKSSDAAAAEKARALNAHGAHVIVNDDGAVVDKRQLLSAGLNVAPKKPAKPSSTASTSTSTPSLSSSPNTTTRFSAASASASSARRAQADRQTALLEAQILQRQREDEEVKAREQREMEERLKSRKSGVEVKGARERYLARKRERERERDEEEGARKGEKAKVEGKEGREGGGGG